jgi:hypothetical protein
MGGSRVRRVGVAMIGLVMVGAACSSSAPRAARHRSRPPDIVQDCSYLTDATILQLLGSEAKRQPAEPDRCSFTLPKRVEKIGDSTSTFEDGLSYSVIPGRIFEMPRDNRFEKVTPVVGLGVPASWWIAKEPNSSHGPTCNQRGQCTESATVSTPGGTLAARIKGKGLVIEVSGTPDDLATATAAARIIISKL